MTEQAQVNVYKITHTDGRPDEVYEREVESSCDHQLVSLGDVPSLPYGKHTMTKGGCIACGNTYVEEKDDEDEHVAFFKKVEEA